MIFPKTEIKPFNSGFVVFSVWFYVSRDKTHTDPFNTRLTAMF
nr:MAG TPA: hypothetical protein [Caudoviricetes sp.]